jgi:hypothetical protein
MKALSKHDVRSGTDSVLKANPKPDISAKIGFDHTGMKFSPIPAELGAFDELACEIAILLMQNWSGHTMSDIIGLQTEP